MNTHNIPFSINKKNEKKKTLHYPRPVAVKHISVRATEGLLHIHTNFKFASVTVKFCLVVTSLGGFFR